MLTPDFARALRKTAVTRYKDMAARYDETVEELLAPTVDGKWTAKRNNALRKEVLKRMRRRSFGIVVTPLNIVTFAPRTQGDRIMVQAVCFDTLPRHRPLVFDAQVAFEMAPHAVERLFLRLDTFDAGPVQAEIMRANYVGFALRAAAQRLSLRQVPLPTRHGAFLCEVIDGQPLLARTWVRNNDGVRGTQTMLTKWARVVKAQVDAMLDWYEDAGEGGPTATDRLIGAAIGSRPQVDDLAAALQQAMAPITWLRSPYEAREDHQGALWARAREQAAARGSATAP